MDSSGNIGNLIAKHPGNCNAVRHGAFARSSRVLSERAQAVADELMDAPHVVPLDRAAAEEIGALVALVEGIDRDLESRGTRGRASLLDVRLRASGRLERWLAAFGATPASRAAWAESVARGGLAAEIAKRRAAGV